MTSSMMRCARWLGILGLSGLSAASASCSNGTIGLAAEGADAAAGAKAPWIRLIPDSPGDAETPATGNPQVVADWLKAGAYRKWRCESEAHEARSPSPHSKNRVCNNRKLAEHGEGEFPVGSASVKEMFDDIGALRSYAVALKTDVGATPAWLWFMSDGARVPVNARGDAPAASDCAGCHLEAGTDAQHSGHDFVYTIVPSPR